MMMGRMIVHQLDKAIENLLCARSNLRLSAAIFIIEAGHVMNASS